MGAHRRNKETSQFALAVSPLVTNTVTSFVTKSLEVLHEARYAWPAAIPLTVLGQP